MTIYLSRNSRVIGKVAVSKVTYGYLLLFACTEDCGESNGK